MRAGIIPVTPFQQNCSILLCEETNRAAIVDPGGDLDQIVAVLEKFGATPEKIFLTHGHIDHCGGTAELRSNGVPSNPRGRSLLIDQLPRRARFGFPHLEAFAPDRWLAGGDTCTSAIRRWKCVSARHTGT